MSGFRQQLAYQVVAGHGLAMFIVFAAPIQLFLLVLAKEYFWPAVLAACLMVAGFIVTLRFAPAWLAVSPTSKKGSQRTSFRWFRFFVGNGDAIQALARRIDPQWNNPYAGRSPQETARWLASMELMHWAVLVASVGPIAAAFYTGYYVFGFIYVAANLVYNVTPNLVIRNTRRRVLRISQRTRLGDAD